MFFQSDPQDQAFREQVRHFLAHNLPPDMARRHRDNGNFSPDADDALAWMRILHRQGWSVPHWPADHGGPGWSARELFIFEEECSLAYAPELPVQGVSLVGPVIYKFGSREQAERFLPPIREGAYHWAQGFSEPGAGSDLASLRTSAVRNGDEFVVNGQKIWTSGAYLARWGFFLVRTGTEGKPQDNLSFLLIDMASPGITIRRIPQMNGEAHLCEVFLDDVKVPAENLVGEAGKGWTYAKDLLDEERVSSSFIHWNKRELLRCKAIAAREHRNGQPLIDQSHYRDRIARLEIEIIALEWSVLRELAAEPSPYGRSNTASVLKLRGSELQQQLTDLQADLLGAKAMRFYDPYDLAPPTEPMWPDYVPGRTNAALMNRATTILGGTKQVQLGIIARSAFGLR